MKSTIIFSHTETGHILEYFHHIYMNCLESSDREYVFIVPEGFKKNMPNMDWPQAQNIKFCFLSDDEVSKYSKGSLWRDTYNMAVLLKRKIELFRADKVLSLFWFPLVPFGVFFFRNNVKISTIFYDVYLRETNNLSKRAILKFKTFYWLLVLFRCVDKCFVLNDELISKDLNNIFHTNKFQYLPDPYVPIAVGKVEDLRKRYNIYNSSIVFAHFGGLSKRKGTINILNAITKLNEQEQTKCVFIFAGSIYEDIKSEFYDLIKKNSNANIIIEDGFCSYEYLASLCLASNAILMPYLFTNRSSGLLGYASQFNIPVIAPNNGLLSEIVKKYKLGMVGDCQTVSGLANMIRSYLENSCIKPDNQYCLDNSVDRFCNIISNSI